MYKPMNAYPASAEVLENHDFIFEPKLDGIRALFVYEHNKIKLISRNGIDITDKYAHLASKTGIKANSCVLDGEIVAFDKNLRPSFSLLQVGKPAYYIIFDILMKDGHSLIHEPLLTRKKILKETVLPIPYRELVFWVEDGKALWKEMVKREFEGVMAKKKTSIYQPGVRSHSWLKIKRIITIDCIIIGYTRGARALASLVLAMVNHAGKLQYIGHVGTGFSMQDVGALIKLLHPLERDNPTGIELTQHARTKNVHWVKPKLVAEVEVREFTAQTIVRQASFVRLRPDKKPKECTFKAHEL